MAQLNGSNGKSSADLEREISEQRNRVEARIGELRDRLSPGQLLDEALSYSKHGGAHFASNLGQQLTSNPLPAALAGIGIAWLIASNASGNNQPVAAPAWRDSDEDYPYARVSSGGVTRISHAPDEAGQWWSEFQTDSSGTFRARADEFGRRAGHFTDEAGKRFSGFIDDAGNRIRQFQDESGNRLDDGLGWANHSWRETRRGIGQAVQNATAGAAALSSRVTGGAQQMSQNARQMSSDLGGNMQSQADQLSRQIMTLFEQQPLIAGALAFAAGAALGATLPHTAQEDQLVGETADEMRRKATQAASDLYQQGKEQVSQAYGEARRTGSELYENAKDRLSDEVPVRH
jgi:hypothetical protein